MSAAKPPVDLTVDLTSADGATTNRWAFDEPDPQNRAQNISFSTSRYEGFKTGGCTLNRPLDSDRRDLGLLDEIRLIGVDGRVAWEGRLARPDRDNTNGPTWQVTATGWMGHARDRRFSAVIIDRDPSHWQGPSGTRQSNLEALAFVFGEQHQSTDLGVGAGVTQTVRGSWDGAVSPVVEAWYDVGEHNRIARVFGAWRRSVISPANPAWSWRCRLHEADDASGASDNTGNLLAAGPGTFDLDASDTTRRYALLQLLYTSPGAGTIGVDGQTYSLFWTDLAVIGDHGLTLVEDDDGNLGVLASDMLRWLIDTYCPKLSTAGIEDTANPIPQLAFLDRTWIYDGMLTVNASELRDLAVWENKTVYYRQIELDDYDWQVRTTDPGVTIQMQGETSQRVISGLEVQYTDVQTGVQSTLLPEDHEELRDDTSSNPYGAAGYAGEDTLQIPSPTTEAHALRLGQLALIERNRQLQVGTITCKGHVMDRAGNWQPAWAVRAEHRIAVMDRDGVPMLIAETDYQHDTRELSVAIGAPFEQLAAELARLQITDVVGGFGG